MPSDRWWIETALFGVGPGRRFTQDNPVLPDVWFAYFGALQSKVDLLIEPWAGVPPFEVAEALRHDCPDAKTTYNRALVAVRLDLVDLVRHVIPRAGWYVDEYHPKGSSSIDIIQLPTVDQVWDDLFPADSVNRPDVPRYAHPRLLSLFRIIGLLGSARENYDVLHNEFQALATAEIAKQALARSNLAQLLHAGFLSAIGDRWPEPRERLIYTINRNRPASLALSNSVRTVKADAAHQVFAIDCSRLTWAVVDSGIDAFHPAFASSSVPGQTRVKETYDFSILRDLLLEENLEKLHPVMRKGHRSGADERDRFSELRARLDKRRSIDWELLRPFLRVPHDDDYVPPTDGHGTHVAGILGAHWDRSNGEIMRGLCPDIRLIDIRVIREDGTSDEFTIASALQFLRHLNTRSDNMVVHGANLSLAIPHDAANYACGQTPVCEEAERAVAEGLVIVAAAGNNGYRRMLVEGEQAVEQFCAVSIADPGNAESVITVGSTHRLAPHTYGVSYFSSRGPTGDGRSKPDIVAPGEKIFAPTLGNSAIRLDGTSMAAPHVSGAAAMLMARHKELMGKPTRIKDVLCKSATDLGRERYFQGHGLLDVLRALQSL